MDPGEQLTSIVSALNVTVDRIQTMQMNDPTPCSAFTVHDVLNHMIVVGGASAYLLRGEQPPDLQAPGVYGWVPAAEFHAAMDSLLDAAQSEGAMERTVTTPYGEMPGETFARLVAFDGLVHAWDLASSTGQTLDVPAAVVSAVDEFARNALTDTMRDGDTFKEATVAPDDAGPLERLAAFSGRTL